MQTKRNYHSSYKPLTTRAHPFEILDGDAVHGYSIISTDLVVFVALENDRGHSSTHTFRTGETDDSRITLAKTTSRPLPEWIDVEAPVGTELRSVMVREWLSSSFESAREMIREAYPAADELVADGRAKWRDGDLETTLEHVAELVGEEG